MPQPVISSLAQQRREFPAWASPLAETAKAAAVVRDNAHNSNAAQTITPQQYDDLVLEYADISYSQTPAIDAADDNSATNSASRIDKDTNSMARYIAMRCGLSKFFPNGLPFLEPVQQAHLQIGDSTSLISFLRELALRSSAKLRWRDRIAYLLQWLPPSLRPRSTEEFYRINQDGTAPKSRRAMLVLAPTIGFAVLAPHFLSLLGVMGLSATVTPQPAGSPITAAVTDMPNAAGSHSSASLSAAVMDNRAIISLAELQALASPMSSISPIPRVALPVVAMNEQSRGQTSNAPQPPQTASARITANKTALPDFTQQLRVAVAAVQTRQAEPVVLASNAKSSQRDKQIIYQGAPRLDSIYLADRGSNFTTNTIGSVQPNSPPARDYTTAAQRDMPSKNSANTARNQGAEISRFVSQRASGVQVPVNTSYQPSARYLLAGGSIEVRIDEALADMLPPKQAQQIVASGANNHLLRLAGSNRNDEEFVFSAQMSLDQSLNKLAQVRAALQRGESVRARVEANSPAAEPLMAWLRRSAARAAVN